MHTHTNMHTPKKPTKMHTQTHTVTYTTSLTHSCLQLDLGPEKQQKPIALHLLFINTVFAYHV